jgi:hypothetical protein
MRIVTSRGIDWPLFALGIFVALVQPDYGIPALARAVVYPVLPARKPGQC